MIGYGNSMFLATHGILARSGGGGGVDPDAQAFITAAAITNPTQQAAINTLVVDLKGYGIWSKMKALYPFVGGTASQHKFNLKDPRDLDAAFRLQFFGGVTHSSTGVQGNGTNGYADTKFNPVSQSSVQNNFSLSVYSRTNLAQGFDIGNTDVWSSGSKGTNIATRYSNGNRYINVANNGYGTLNAETDSRGFYCGGTNSSATQILYKNGSNVLSGTSSQSGFSNCNLLIGAVNDLFFGVQQYVSKQYAFSSIGDGLTPTEAANFYTAVQAFQTTLGRQI